MYVIAGLGNPGAEYENTRHNIGYITIDRLAEKHKIKISRFKFKALVGKGRIEGQKVLLVKPRTFMNLSGESVREAMDYYRLSTENLIVVYDDVDLELGALRLRKSGSAGTHNGMRSVEEHLGSGDFPRIRIGMGRPPDGDLVSFVIGGFTKEEAPVLEEAVTAAVSAIECMIGSGVDLAMNRYNTRKRPKKENE